MSLLEDIQEDNKILEAEVRDMVDYVTKMTKRSLEQENHVPPVVVTFLDNKMEMELPQWRNSWERGKVLERVNERLIEEDAEAVIYAFLGSYKPKKSPAICITAHTPTWRELIILPYRQTPSGRILWGETVVIPSYTGPVLGVSSLN